MNARPVEVKEHACSVNLNHSYSNLAESELGQELDKEEEDAEERKSYAFLFRENKHSNRAQNESSFGSEGDQSYKNDGEIVESFSDAMARANE